MPAATPVKRAQTDKQFKTDPNAYYDPRIMSENMYGLLEYLRQRGDVGKVYVKHLPNKDLSTGSYRIDDRSVATIAENPRVGTKNLAHEITHALNRSASPSRDERIMEHLQKHPWASRKLVFPTSWEQGKVGAPLTKEHLGSSAAPIPASGVTDLRAFLPHGRALEMFYETAKRRTRAVRDSIPEREEWSGLRATSKDKQHYHADQEEGQAYYLTDPMVARPMTDRAKQYGMFLRSHGVPMELVAPIVEELSTLQRPEKRWTGGSYEVRKLRESQQIGGQR